MIDENLHEDDFWQLTHQRNLQAYIQPKILCAVFQVNKSAQYLTNLAK
jgi:hypothetical protein